MKEKIISIIKPIWAALLKLKIIIGVLAMIIGAYTGTRKIVRTLEINAVEKHKKEQIDNNRWAKVDRIISMNVADSLFKKQIIDSLRIFSQDIKETKQYSHITFDAMTLHLTNDKKWDELMRLKDEQINELKKNDNPLQDTVKPTNSFSIKYIKIPKPK